MGVSVDVLTSLLGLRGISNNCCLWFCGPVIGSDKINKWHTSAMHYKKKIPCKIISHSISFMNLRNRYAQETGISVEVGQSWRRSKRKARLFLHLHYIYLLYQFIICHRTWMTISFLHDRQQLWAYINMSLSKKATVKNFPHNFVIIKSPRKWVTEDWFCLFKISDITKPRDKKLIWF